MTSLGVCDTDHVRFSQKSVLVWSISGYMWMIWSSPLQIAIAVYMLYGIVGSSVLAGLAVMILLIPINGVLATFQRKLQIAQMSQKDQRIKLMNEVLNGMKVRSQPLST